MDFMMAQANEDDSNKVADVVVGGELITYTAQLIGETSSKPAIEREWLSALTRAKKEILLRLKNLKRKQKELEQLSKQLKQISILGNKFGFGTD